LVSLARERDLPVAMHIAESIEELELLGNGVGPFQQLLEERSMWDAEAIPRRSRPLDYLRTLAETPRALVIHGNYLDEEERVFLASHAEKMSLVFCPRTHDYFGHPRYPLPELLSAGVHVALGTDSRASNPDLDLLAEMRYVANECPNIDPQTILRLGTLAGAAALGCASDVGSITPGKIANMIAVPLAEEAKMASEMLHGIFTGCARPLAVWLRGDRVR
jgi:cytosine/adenosine deaminase-related metal-dependent hydrolase